MQEREHTDAPLPWPTDPAAALPPEPPPPSRARPRGGRRPILVAAGVAGVLAVAAGAWFAGKGSGSTPTAAASSPSPSQITITGTLTLMFGASFDPNARDTAVTGTQPRLNDPCVAIGGYNDITQGAAVTIGGQTGQTLGIGALSAGNVGVTGAENNAVCLFDFSVAVPSGQSVYTVTISHRGTQTFTPAEVQQTLQLSLGN